MKRIAIAVFVLLVCVAATSFPVVQKGKAGQAITSVYTDLASNKCKTLETDEQAGYSKQVCAGVAGYGLTVEEGDSRQTVSVVSPKGKAYPLNFSSISSGFSSVGQKAEWRLKNKKPIALIVRFNASEDPSDSTKITSYLTVTKITSREICVTDVIKPSAQANESARKAADVAASKQCKEIE